MFVTLIFPFCGKSSCVLEYTMSWSIGAKKMFLTLYFGPFFFFFLLQSWLSKVFLSITQNIWQMQPRGHLHHGQAWYSDRLSFDTSLITLMYHILIRLGGLTLLQAPHDLPAGCERGYLEWASFAKCLQIHTRIREVCFWENASPIISCLISSWKSGRAPGLPSSSPISVKRGTQNVKKPI